MLKAIARAMAIPMMPMITEESTVGALQSVVSRVGGGVHETPTPRAVTSPRRMCRCRGCGRRRRRPRGALRVGLRTVLGGGVADRGGGGLVGRGGRAGGPGDGGAG